MEKIRVQFKNVCFFPLCQKDTRELFSPIFILRACWASRDRPMKMWRFPKTEPPGFLSLKLVHTQPPGMHQLWFKCSYQLLALMSSAPSNLISTLVLCILPSLQCQLGQCLPCDLSLLMDLRSHSFSVQFLSCCEGGSDGFQILCMLGLGTFWDCHGMCILGHEIAQKGNLLCVNPR